MIQMLMFIIIFMLNWGVTRYIISKNGTILIKSSLTSLIQCCFWKKNATWKVISKLDCFLDIHILTDKKHHGKVIFHKQHWWLWYPLSQKLSVDRKHKKKSRKTLWCYFYQYKRICNMLFMKTENSSATKDY